MPADCTDRVEPACIDSKRKEALVSKLDAKHTNFNDPIHASEHTHYQNLIGSGGRDHMGLIPNYFIMAVASDGAAMTYFVPFSFTGVSCENLFGSQRLVFDKDLMVLSYSTPTSN